MNLQNLTLKTYYPPSPLAGRWICQCWWGTWSWLSTNQSGCPCLTPSGLSSRSNTRWITTCSPPRGHGEYSIDSCPGSGVYLVCITLDMCLHKKNNPLGRFNYTLSIPMLVWILDSYILFYVLLSLLIVQEAQGGAFGSDTSWWTGSECPRRAGVRLWSLHIADCQRRSGWECRPSGTYVWVNLFL